MDDRPTRTTVDDGPLDGTLIGRARELEQLRAFLAAARVSGQAMVLVGEPGVGKTGLLDLLFQEATWADTRVLRAAGVEFEASLGFSALNQLLLPVLDVVPDLPAVHRDALNIALGFGSGPAPDRLVVSNATLVLLRTVATARPLLILIDDLPWLDRASAGVLGFVARRLEDSRIGLIGAARTGEEHLFDHGGMPELVVGPLDDSASRQLLQARFPGLTPAVRDRVLTESQGYPLALLELPTALAGIPSAAERTPTILPLGRRLRNLYAPRIARMPPPTQRLLLRMALDGTGDTRVLEAGHGSSIGFRDLVPAEEARLAHLAVTDRRLAFRHPLVRSTVVELSSAEDRRAAHRALAEAWTDQPDRRAWHLAEATVEPDEQVASELEAAAARVLGRGDAIGCITALTRSAELSPHIDQRRRRLAAAASIGADVTGDLRHASQVLADLRRGAIALEGSLQAAVAASLFLLQGEGDVVTAHRLLVGALDARVGTLDGRDPVVIEALHALQLICGYGSAPELWWAFEATLDRTAAVPLALELSRTTFADPARSAGELAKLDAILADLGNETDPTQVIRLAVAATYIDRLEACRPALSRLIDDGRHGGAVASGLQAMLVLAFEEYLSGTWDRGDALVEEAVAICEPLGYLSATWPGRYVQALIAASRGDQERTLALTDGLLQWGRPRGIRVAEWWAWQARGLAAIARGDFEGAYDMSSRISPAGELAPYVPFALYVMLDLVESAMRTGRIAEATAHVTAMRTGDIDMLSPRVALVVGGCAAIVSADDSALPVFETTLALPGIERWPFDHARVLLAYGERLRRARNMSQARVPLAAALDTFERLAAGPWIERATAELRATGMTKPRLGEDVLDRLTPQEYEIATLAASGLTNKQIAERLYLSHRTVGGHLHRVFPKLGIATRAALRDALEALPPERRPNR